MDDLRKLAEAATSGEWHTNLGFEHDVWTDDRKIAECANLNQADVYRKPSMDECCATAAYIAACSPDRILKLLDVVEAARTYYERYAQDEADDGGAWENHHPHSSFTTGCSVEQAQDALALRRALAALSGAGTRTASDE